MNDAQHPDSNSRNPLCRDSHPGAGPDPLFEGIDGLPEGTFSSSGPSEAFKEALFERTRVVIRRRAWRRKGLAAGLAAAGFAAGMLFMALLGGGSGPVDPDPVAGEAGRVEDSGSPLEKSLEELTPGELIRRAEASPPEERAVLLTLAGDRLLVGGVDIEQALTCYRDALDLMPPALGLRMDPEDSWLMAALKEARR